MGNAYSCSYDSNHKSAIGMAELLPKPMNAHTAIQQEDPNFSTESIHTYTGILKSTSKWADNTITIGNNEFVILGNIDALRGLLNPIVGMYVTAEYVAESPTTSYSLYSYYALGGDVMSRIRITSMKIADAITNEFDITNYSNRSTHTIITVTRCGVDIIVQLSRSHSNYIKWYHESIANGATVRITYICVNTDLEFTENEIIYINQIAPQVVNTEFKMRGYIRFDDNGVTTTHELIGYIDDFKYRLVTNSSIAQKMVTNERYKLEILPCTFNDMIKIVVSAKLILR